MEKPAEILQSGFWTKSMDLGITEGAGLREFSKTQKWGDRSFE